MSPVPWLGASVIRVSPPVRGGPGVSRGQRTPAEKEGASRAPGAPALEGPGPGPGPEPGSGPGHLGEPASPPWGPRAAPARPAPHSAAPRARGGHCGRRRVRKLGGRAAEFAGSAGGTTGPRRKRRDARQVGRTCGHPARSGLGSCGAARGRKCSSVPELRRPRTFSDLAQHRRPHRGGGGARGGARGLFKGTERRPRARALSSPGGCGRGKHRGFWWEIPMLRVTAPALPTS